MPIDPSIPLQAQPPQQPDYLGQFGKYAGLSNALAQNKLLDIASQRQQIGVDADKVSLQQAQQNQATQGMGRTAQQAASLLTLPTGQLTPDRINAVIDDETKAGTIPQQAAQVWKQRVASIGDNDAALRGLLTQHLVGTLAGPQAVASIIGTPGSMSNGQVTQPGVQNGALNPAGGGAFTPSGGGVVQLLSPGQKATMVPTINPSGQPGNVPLSSVVNDQGNPQGAPMGPGRYQPPPAQPGQTSADGVPMSSNNPTGFVPTGLPPGAADNITAYNTAQADVPQAVNRIAGLQKAYQALQMVNTGPGTGTWQQLRSTLQSLPVINGLTKPDIGNEDSIANYDLARKYLQDYANRSTVGSTAQGLQASAHANASTDISQGAALDVVRSNIGLERMAIAQTQGANGQSYLSDAKNFALNNDRRAFAADLYSPQQLKQLVGGMKDNDKTRFFRSLGVAQRLGLVSLPQSQAAGPAVASATP